MLWLWFRVGVPVVARHAALPASPPTADQQRAHEELGQ